jgi:hypothetical protein
MAEEEKSVEVWEDFMVMLLHFNSSIRGTTPCGPCLKRFVGDKSD